MPHGPARSPVSGSRVLFAELLHVLLDELVHPRGLLPDELCKIVRKSIVSTLLMKVGHCSQMADDMGGHTPFLKFLGPSRDRHVPIPDRPPERV